MTIVECENFFISKKGGYLLDGCPDCRLVPVYQGWVCKERGHIYPIGLLKINKALYGEVTGFNRSCNNKVSTHDLGRMVKYCMNCYAHRGLVRDCGTVSSCTD